jgi:hypothetical protein
MGSNSLESVNTCISAVGQQVESRSTHTPSITESPAFNSSNSLGSTKMRIENGSVLYSYPENLDVQCAYLIWKVMFKTHPARLGNVAWQGVAFQCLAPELPA